MTTLATTHPTLLDLTKRLDPNGKIATIAEMLSQALGGARFAVPQEQGSVGFPAGHWRQYAQALAGPFATLTPVAVRLGYPEA